MGHGTVPLEPGPMAPRVAIASKDRDLVRRAPGGEYSRERLVKGAPWHPPPLTSMFGLSPRYSF